MNMKKYILLLLIPLLFAGCVRKSELDKANLELAKANSTVSQLNAKLDQANVKISALEAEIARLKPLAEEARELPVKTKIIKTTFGSGYTLLVYNLARISLRLEISENGNSIGSRVIDGGRELPLPRLAFGDKVVISSNGYDPLTVMVH